LCKKYFYNVINRAFRYISGCKTGFLSRGGSRSVFCAGFVLHGRQNGLDVCGFVLVQRAFLEVGGGDRTLVPALGIEVRLQLGGIEFSAVARVDLVESERFFFFAQRTDFVEADIALVGVFEDIIV